MAIIYYNPYSYMEDLTKLYDYITNNFPPGGDLHDLNTVILSFLGGMVEAEGMGVGSGSGSGEAKEIGILKGLLSPILPNAANNYINLRISEQLRLNERQAELVDCILTGIGENLVDSLPNFFEDSLEQMSKANITDADKSSLYIALNISRATYLYWNSAYENWLNPTGPINPWITDSTINTGLFYQNLRSWVAASFVGSLAGFSQLQANAIGNASVTTDLGGFAGIAGSLIGGSGLFSGLVLFKWSKGYCQC